MNHRSLLKPGEKKNLNLILESNFLIKKINLLLLSCKAAISVGHKAKKKKKDIPSLYAFKNQKCMG